jgi:predicted RNA-binding Zn-ribbon protein involved in translation (DUF1610 family)
MTVFTPATPYSDSIKRPNCPRCGTRMMLARIRPVAGKSNHDERTFDCPKCGNEVIEVVKFK